MPTLNENTNTHIVFKCFIACLTVTAETLSVVVKKTLPFCKLCSLRIMGVNDFVQ